MYIFQLNVIIVVFVLMQEGQDDMLKLLINLGSDVHLTDFKRRTGECFN